MFYSPVNIVKVMLNREEKCKNNSRIITKCSFSASPLHLLTFLEQTFPKSPLHVSMVTDSVKWTQRITSNTTEEAIPQCNRETNGTLCGGVVEEEYLMIFLG